MKYPKLFAVSALGAAFLAACGSDKEPAVSGQPAVITVGRYLSWTTAGCLEIRPLTGGLALVEVPVSFFTSRPNRRE